MLLRTKTCLTLLVIVWAQVSCQQDGVQPSNKEIKRAITKLGNRIEEKLEVLLEDKLSEKLETMKMAVNERLNTMELNLDGIKQAMNEEFKEMKVKIDQCEDGCVCRSGDLFCTTKACRPDQETTDEAIIASLTVSSAQHTPANTTGQATTAVQSLCTPNANTSISGVDMYKAAERGDVDCVKKALASGIDVNWRDSDSWTALHAAAESNNSAPVVRVLLEAGAEKDSQTYGRTGGITPIHAASMTGKTEMVNILIAHGANVNIQTVYGATPLISAASLGRLNITKALLDANANVWTVDTGRNTALHWAAFNNKVDIVPLLLQAGAEKWAETNQGLTPADRARKRGHDELADIIEGFTKP